MSALEQHQSFFCTIFVTSRYEGEGHVGDEYPAEISADYSGMLDDTQGEEVMEEAEEYANEDVTGGEGGEEEHYEEE